MSGDFGAKNEFDGDFVAVCEARCRHDKPESAGTKFVLKRVASGETGFEFVVLEMCVGDGGVGAWWWCGEMLSCYGCDGRG